MSQITTEHAKIESLEEQLAATLHTAPAGAASDALVDMTDDDKVAPQGVDEDEQLDTESKVPADAGSRAGMLTGSQRADDQVTVVLTRLPSESSRAYLIYCL